MKMAIIVGMVFIITMLFITTSFFSAFTGQIIEMTEDNKLNLDRAKELIQPRNYICPDNSKAVDASQCPKYCGDDICDSKETCENCQKDCGDCNVSSPQQKP